MAQTSKLRAVKADEQPNPAASLVEAADIGSTRAMLVAMRARIAKAVQDENTSTRDLASLSKRLMEIQRDIDAIDAQAADESGEVADDAPLDASAL